MIFSLDLYHPTNAYDPGASCMCRRSAAQAHPYDNNKSPIVRQFLHSGRSQGYLEMMHQFCLAA